MAATSPTTSQELRNYKHERFCTIVAATTEGVYDVENAYIGAGYKCDRMAARASGFRLLADATIKGRIAEKRLTGANAADQAAARVINKAQDVREEVLAGLRKVAEMSLEPATFNPAGANRAFELIGKEHGLFIDRSDSTVHVDAKDELPKDKLAEWRDKIKAKQQAQVSDVVAVVEDKTESQLTN